MIVKMDNKFAKAVNISKKEDGRKTFVVGDIHGRVQALLQVLKLCNYENDDLLIVLGDLGDKYTIKGVLDILVNINCIFIIGNHDILFIKNMIDDERLRSSLPESHISFISKGKLYHEQDNMLFVHAGIEPNKKLNEQSEQTLTNDRDLITFAQHNIVGKYHKVFIGHTSTQSIERGHVNFLCRDCNHNSDRAIKNVTQIPNNPICSNCKSKNIFQSLGCTKPLKIGNVYCLDTGAAWDGKLTIMDIKTNQYWQSYLQQTII